jgi:CBS domain-containing protein
MVTVEKLLKEKKSNAVWSVTPQQTVFEALELMAEKGVGALLVMDGEELVGILSERDYARKGIIAGRKAKSTPVTELMTAKVITVTLQMTCNDCMGIMSNLKFRHLPVVEKGAVVGILSIGDIVNAMIDEQVHHIDYLEHYITGDII